MGLTCWIDASAGIAGDMLLGALLDAGANLTAVRAAVEAVAPGEVVVDAEEVTRHGLRATKAVVHSVHGDVADRHGEAHHHGAGGGQHHPHRAWSDIDRMIAGAGLPEPVDRRTRDVFARIAVAEGRAHGVAPADVQFHEVGAWDSIGDVVGICAALHDLGVEHLCVGDLAVGSGTVHMAHGQLAVPGPAVVELSRGLVVQPGPVRSELATPTGLAFLAGRPQGPMPAMRVLMSGTGAGTKDFDSHANVVRVVIGEAVGTQPDVQEELVVLECTVDDLDPRLWPGVIDTLVAAGAKDAWLTPVLMKKGRPGHVLSVLTDRPDDHRRLVFAHTTTLGVREHRVGRTALDREWRPVDVQGHTVQVKLGLLGAQVVTAQPEFRDVQALATALGIPEAEALLRATAAAQALL